MEFWGVEVKSGKSLSVEVEENSAVHLSQVCLGEGRDKGNDPIYLYVTINEQKIMLGTLSPKKLSQQHFDLVFDKSFKLSHSWKNGTVNFIGYKCENKDESDLSDYGSDSDSGDIPLDLAEQIKEARAAAAQQKANLAGSKKDVKEDDSSDDSHEDSSEDEQDSDEDEGNESDSSDSEAEETPKKSPVKVEKVSKKRPAESATETGKKAKLVTPKKSGTDNKKNNVHVDTPYPSKQKAGKTSANESKQKTPESGGSHSCGPCKRSFKSDKALESHSKAKHSGEK